MILIDANLLIYAINRDAPAHIKARGWLESVLSGSETVAITWGVILAFLRITTHPAIMQKPLRNSEAIAYVEEWLQLPVVETLSPGDSHWPLLRNLLLTSGTQGNLTADAHLAAIALENGADIYSADHDFQRFQGLRHINPLV